MKSRRLCDNCKCKDCRARRDVAKSLEAKGMGYWVPRAGEFILVPGMSGMGKSTWGKGLMEFLLGEGVNQYAWDPARELSIHGTQRENAPLGPLTHQVTVTELEEDPEILCEVAHGRSAAAVAIVPDEEFPSREQRADDFVRAMGLILPNRAAGKVVLHVEECGLLEDHQKAETTLVEIATTWRKEGFAGAFYTQAISMVPDRARRQCRKVVAYAQRDRWDRQALSDLVSPRYARAVMKLKEFECLHADRMDVDAWAGEDALEETSAESAA